jgi:cytochrome c2/cytochrome b561
MERTYGRLAVVSGWLVTLGYLAHQIITVRLPRSPKVSELREDLRNWHYLVGSLLFAFVVARLYAWWRDGRPAVPASLSSAAFTWGRALALGSMLLVLLAPFLGIAFAWSDGFALRLFGISVPALIEENRALWMFSGYFHSGTGFMLLLLNLATVITAGYTTLRYGRGLVSAFPPGYGAFSFAGLTLTVYAFATFRSPDPGPRAVLTFWLICGAVALVGWWLAKRRQGPADRPRKPFSIQGWAGIAAPLGVAAIVLAGAYGPYALFRVTPWPMTEVVQGGPRKMVMQVSLPPETEFERTTAQETYKWCRFCHTMNQGEKALVGPNLWAIFGQRAGTSPGFAYSKAMAEARDKGLVWDDRTIAEYIRHPDVFMPGTSMIISSGPVSDPKVRAAVVNILKRDTMTQK